MSGIDPESKPVAAEGATFNAPQVPTMGELAAEATDNGRHPEGVAQLPSCQELYDRYRYQPPKWELPPVEQAGFSLADPAVSQQFLSHGEELIREFEARNPDGQQQVSVKRAFAVAAETMAEVAIRPSEKLRMEGDPEEHYVQLKIFRDKVRTDWGQEHHFVDRIVDFFAYLPNRKHADWQLHHRLVGDAYREQGMGSAMLQLFEQIVQAEATRRREPQQLTIDANQVDVILFALKRGYGPATSHDHDRLAAFMGDDGSQFVLGDDWGYRSDRSPRVGFIFQKSQDLADTIDSWSSTDEEDRPASVTVPESITTEKIRELTGKEFFGPDVTEQIVYTVQLAKRFEPVGSR